MKIDKIIVATTLKSKNRNEYINSIKDKIGDFSFFYGVDERDKIYDFVEKNKKKILFHPLRKCGILYLGQIGCYITHYLILKKIYNEKIQNTIVLENDINFSKDDWELYIEKIMNSELPNDYDMLLLYSRSRNINKREYRIKGKKKITKYNKTSGAVAYLISLNGVKKMLHLLESTYIKPFDLFIKDLGMNEDNKVFNLVTKLIGLINVKSTIKSDDKNKLMISNNNNNFFKFYKLADNFKRRIIFVYMNNVDNTERISPFEIIAKSFIYYFEKKNYECILIEVNNFNPKMCKNKDIVFIFSSILWIHRNRKICDSIKKLPSQNNNIIIYNTEPLEYKLWYDKIYDKIIDGADMILDYSYKNLSVYKNFKNKYYCPPCFSPYLNELWNKNNINHKVEKDIDILFYGSMNGNRMNIKNQLEKQNINHKFIYSFKNLNDQNEYIKRSKIILSISWNEVNNVIDFARISYLIANRFFIIHELPSESDRNEDFCKNVITVPSNDIVSKCVKFLKFNQIDRDNLALKTHIWFKNYYSIDKFIPYNRINELYIYYQSNIKKFQKIINKIKLIKNDLLLDLSNKPIDFRLTGDSIIVGSSGKLLRYNLGNNIDKYNNIIRLNFSPSKNYEDNVGSRTDIRFIRNNAIRKINNKKNLRSYLTDSDTVIFIGESRIDSVKKYMNDNVNYIKINKKYLDIFNKIFEKSCSTGLYTVILSYIFSDNNLDLCGFMNLGDISGKDKYHYWENLNGKQSNLIGRNDLCHAMYDESSFVKELISNIIC